MTAIQTAADPVREAILAAMDRLLAGMPLRSSGRLSISQLAVEAGSKRWHLTHQHLGLKELFEVRVKAAAATPQAFAKRLSDHDELKDKHAKLIKYCAELEERLQSYASAINLLALENVALAAASDTRASVIPLPRPETSP
ncbi:hypothetical protein [Streptomyces sp. NBC_01092]|uniref:hypothetical protein n=1 Tax=Streptomyces sp. NBC_01092 TaxID=2903748 RepID=UPI003869C8FB|nr:hypothetical protein OG254_49120 [Streptomyces sp. NBC_01092]